jgi:hypothetical protein
MSKYAPSSGRDEIVIQSVLFLLQDVSAQLSVLMELRTFWRVIKMAM